MGKSAKPPPPPDTSRFTAGLERQAAESQEWARQMWQTGQEEWGRLQKWSQQYMGAALPAMEEAFGWASEQRDRFNEYVMPQMQSLFSEAETYASKEEEMRQRAAAVQDVKSATEAQRESQLRKLEGYGIDPSETRYQALDKQAGVAEAAASALAANQAGERTKEIGRTLRSEAIDVGSRFLDDATRSAQTGAQVGGQAMSGASQAAGTGATVAQGAIPYTASASRDLDTAAGIVDTSYGRQIDYADARNRAARQDFDMWSGIGSGLMAWNPIGKHFKPTGTGAAEGGPITAPGGPTDDASAIPISDGEYVIPADVVRKLGTNHFDKLIEKETGRPPPSQKQAIPIPQGGR